MSLTATDALRAHLLGSQAIADLVGDRIRPHFQPQTAQKPYVVYSVISADPQHHLLGASGLSFVRVQLDLYGDDFGQLEDLANAIRNRADGYKGTITVGDESLAVQCIELVDIATSAETANDGTDSGPHRIRMDFRISAPESIPSFT